MLQPKKTRQISQVVDAGEGSFIGSCQDEEKYCSGGTKSRAGNLLTNKESLADGKEGTQISAAKDEWDFHYGIKCSNCSQIFTVKEVFDKHYQDNYLKPPVYQCSTCNKVMDHYTTFQSHTHSHMIEGRYRCEFCQKKFSRRNVLLNHVVSKHSSVKPHACSGCGKGYCTKKGLRLHLEKHKEGEKQVWICQQCGKILYTLNGYKAHLTVHRLGKQFMCDVCGKCFNRKVNLQQHQKGHTGERPYSCNLCGKRFSEKTHLNRHYVLHSNERPFKCNVCTKMFKTDRCLKVHSTIHTDSRSYVCSVCGKGFLNNKALKQHYSVHTGSRPYKCNYCERTFTNYSNRVKHTRRRHKTEMGVRNTLLAENPVGVSTDYVMDLSDSFGVMAGNNL